jgi:sugar lactone lactonase YvrE
VLTYDAGGQMGVFLGGLQSPNGIYPDLAGAVWITEFGGSRVLRVGADLTMTTIVTGAEASSANWVVYDPQRALLFYTKYQAGQIQRVVIDGQGEPGAPELVAAVAGAALDGLTLDACGNIYAIDQKNSRLYRARLDGAWAAIGEPALLAEFPSNVANAQFGVGEGFDPHTLYVAGNPGDVYTLVVEFPGAATVTVQ